MLGEVVDEDELATDERREGIYNGLFTFLRKLAGAVAVFVALGILDLSGLEAGVPAGPTTRWAIRLLATLAPARASPSAAARPRPRVAPVTSATFPVRSKTSSMRAPCCEFAKRPMLGE